MKSLREVLLHRAKWIVLVGILAQRKGLSPYWPWVDGDGMLVEPMEILGNRWKQGMEFRVSEEKKKGMRLLFSSRNAVTPRGVGLQVGQAGCAPKLGLTGAGPDSADL